MNAHQPSLIIKQLALTLRTTSIKRAINKISWQFITIVHFGESAANSYDFVQSHLSLSE